MRGLKYIQTELLELTQIHNSIREKSPHLANEKSIYKQLILPLLSSVECGGFVLFASPIIFIPNYSDETGGYQGRMSYLSPREEASRNMPQNRGRSLTAIYGDKVFLNHKALSKQSKPSGQDTQAFSFLQDNIDEIDDPMLKMMPLLKQITKENVIPIMDFEDPNQCELNFLVLHVADCIPSVSVWQSVSMLVPFDQGEAVRYTDLKDLQDVSISQVSTYLNGPKKASGPPLLDDTPLKGR